MDENPHALSSVEAAQRVNAVETYTTKESFMFKLSSFLDSDHCQKYAVDLTGVKVLFQAREGFVDLLRLQRLAGDPNELLGLSFSSQILGY